MAVWINKLHLKIYLALGFSAEVNFVRDDRLHIYCRGLPHINNVLIYIFFKKNDVLGPKMRVLFLLRHERYVGWILSKENCYTSHHTVLKIPDESPE
jgi:hypothetical protein